MEVSSGTAGAAVAAVDGLQPIGQCADVCCPLDEIEFDRVCLEKKDCLPMIEDRPGP